MLLLLYLKLRGMDTSLREIADMREFGSELIGVTLKGKNLLHNFKYKEGKFLSARDASLWKIKAPQA